MLRKSTTDVMFALRVWWRSLEKARRSCSVSLLIKKSIWWGERGTAELHEKVRSGREVWEVGARRQWDSGELWGRGDTGFKVGVWLPQAQALGTFLLVMGMDRLTHESLWCLQMILSSIVRAGCRWKRVWTGTGMCWKEEEWKSV